MSWRTDRTTPMAKSAAAQATRTTAPLAGERRCSTLRPMSPSAARAGTKRPTEGTRPKRRGSTTSPQASRVMIASSRPGAWLRAARRRSSDSPRRDQPARAPAHRARRRDGVPSPTGATAARTRQCRLLPRLILPRRRAGRPDPSSVRSPQRGESSHTVRSNPASPAAGAAGADRHRCAASR